MLKKKFRWTMTGLDEAENIIITERFVKIDITTLSTNKNLVLEQWCLMSEEDEIKEALRGFDNNHLVSKVKLSLYSGAGGLIETWTLINTKLVPAFLDECIIKIPVEYEDAVFYSPTYSEIPS